MLALAHRLSPLLLLSVISLRHFQVNGLRCSARTHIHTMPSSTPCSADEYVLSQALCMLLQLSSGALQPLQAQRMLPLWVQH